MSDRIYALYSQFTETCGETEEELYRSNHTPVFTVELPSSYHCNLIEEYMYLNHNYQGLDFRVFHCSEVKERSSIEHFTYLEFLAHFQRVLGMKIEQEQQYLASEELAVA